MSFWALIDLESRISTRDEVAGVEIAAAVNGQPCHILFPRLPATKPRFTFEPSEPPTTSRFPSIRHPNDSGPWDVLNPRVWGGYSYSSDSVTLHLSHLGSRFDDLEKPDWKLLAAAARWRNRLLGWLHIWHGELADTIEVYDPVMWVGDDDVVPTFVYEPTKPVDLHTWKHAIYHATAGDEIPLTPLLVYRAFRSRQEGNHRQAVVDAATAFELTLHAVLKKAIDDSDQQRLGIADAILKSVALGRMIALARSLGIWIPDNCLQEVAQTRNSTLHDGRPPSAAQTSSLLRATVDLMNHYEGVVGYTNLDCKHELPDHSCNA